MHGEVYWNDACRCCTRHGQSPCKACTVKAIDAAVLAARAQAFEEAMDAAWDEEQGGTERASLYIVGRQDARADIAALREKARKPGK